MRHTTFVQACNASIGSLIALSSVACVAYVGDVPSGRTQLDPNVSAPAVALGQAFNQVAEAVRPTVVFIRNESRRGRARAARTGRAGAGATSTGTGFIVREDGYVVTNYHVIEGAHQLFVRLYDEREYLAELVGSDPLTDLAVLKIAETGLPVAELGDSDAVRVGHWVIAIGNPLGRALSFSVTAGIVSATERTLVSGRSGPTSVLDYIQTDAVANTGNSGGPLIDLYGRIVGVNAAIFSTTGSYQGYTLAIPANLVEPVVARLIEDGTVRRTGLGVTVEDASLEDATAVGLKSVYGVVVQDASAGGGAAQLAGLRDGDVIVAVDGVAITSTAQLQRAVWFRRSGDEVSVSVRRDGGGASTLSVPLQWLASDNEDEPEERPEDEVAPPCSDNPLGLCLVEAGDDPTEGADPTENARGLFVRNVYSVGPSFGKLMPNVDVITHVNGVRVRSLDDLDSVLSDCMAGQIVSVRTYQHRTQKRGFTRVRLRG